MSDTVPRMGRPRGELTPAQKKRMLTAHMKAGSAAAKYRATVVRVLAEGASFAEVSKETGLSTATLQRWKRGATQ